MKIPTRKDKNPTDQFKLYKDPVENEIEEASHQDKPILGIFLWDNSTSHFSAMDKEAASVLSDVINTITPKLIAASNAGLYSYKESFFAILDQTNSEIARAASVAIKGSPIVKFRTNLDPVTDVGSSAYYYSKLVSILYGKLVKWGSDNNIEISIKGSISNTQSIMTSISPSDDIVFNWVSAKKNK